MPVKGGVERTVLVLCVYVFVLFVCFVLEKGVGAKNVNSLNNATAHF